MGADVASRFTPKGRQTQFQRGDFAMVKKALAYLLILGAVHPLCAAADDTIARFKGGIGVIPVSSGVGVAPTATVVNRNIVRNVQPAGQPWVIDKLDATVRANGQISVKGRGLILAGSNNAGRAAGQSVFATLICEAAPPFTEHSSTLAGVRLAASGDFEIDDVLSALPLPVECASPMLLIRNAAGQAWFAVGIPKRDGDD
jgi:hypothetical protein